MKTLLLTAIAWASKIPGSTINEIYTAAAGIVAKNDAEKNVSGWEKLKTTVEYLVGVVPVNAPYKEIASTVITIVVNVAVLVIRMRGAAAK